MKSSKTPISIFLPLLLLGACAPSGSGNNADAGSHSGSGGTSGGSGGTSGGSGGSSACSGTKVMAAEANDYMFSSTLTLQSIDVKSMSNLTIDWGDLSKDFEGHSLDPKKDINQVLFIDWLFPLDQLEKKINADDLNGNVFEGLPLGFTTDGNTTSAKVYDFSLATGGDIQQSDIDPFLDPAVSPSSTHTLTVIAATGSKLGAGTRMIQAMALNSSSSNTTVKLQNDSTKLQFSANLHDLSPTYVTSGQKAISLDWGKLKKTAMGGDFDPTSITHALLGKYSQSPSDLEGDNFLNLQTIAQEMYEGDIDSGTVVDFSNLKTSDGKSFSGISSDGTWLVALICGGCKNPAPLFLTVLKPCN